LSEAWKRGLERIERGERVFRDLRPGTPTRLSGEGPASGELRRRAETAWIRGDYLAEENERLKKEGVSLRMVEKAALSYCEAASEGLPAAKLGELFRELIGALGWRRERR